MLHTFAGYSLPPESEVFGRSCETYTKTRDRGFDDHEVNPGWYSSSYVIVTYDVGLMIYSCYIILVKNIDFLELIIYFKFYKKGFHKFI